MTVIGIAYVVGWMADAVLNDDPCRSAYGLETYSYDYVQRWFPVRTDCRVSTASGARRIVSGSSEVFLAMFGLTLVTGLALLLSGLALAVRAAAVLASCVAAFLVIFVL